MDNFDASKDMLYIGWDVGGWNCDSNSKSRDALVVLDGRRRLLGKPWRGNLRKVINQAATTAEWIQALLECCEVTSPSSKLPVVTLAIDTPLGFSLALQQLITGGAPVDRLDESAANPYLFRFTERFLFQQGLAPLSAVKDMIGSQATKGMHALAKFAPQRKSVGVWEGDGQLQAIEAYPSSCRHSDLMATLLEPFCSDRRNDAQPLRLHWRDAAFVENIDHDDKRDALICALIAWLFVNQPEQLQPPEPDTPLSEGWIFVPQDGLDTEKKSANTK
ncbi:DUF429 domain-containing protein [Hahella aquimaris]|uniref:DUF429 domain-containing protein n=1 Tax=Hahella sp. HNIBRBA332 TaxID=3015983 RepID=UPI00273B0969|nr:DUF429 domain-containing protein [Hahella sp. HNIBRBA332]WLQ16274.1 DUF429 domain-containing protein [Hahella sp. HNIBRBA332]